MNKHTIWIDKLFHSYTYNSEIAICFEQKEKLQSSQKVINLSIHPLRFGDDIFFNFETNDVVLKAKIKKYEVNYDIFYIYADLVKATYLKTTKKNNITDNSLLLVGQTQQDKVIFNGVKYLSLLDYIEDIILLSKKYNSIYFKPHPYSTNNKKLLKSLKKYLPNVKIIYDNIYHLLSNDNIKHVVALNSSVLYEAKYFHKQVTFLYKPVYDFKNNDIGIYGDYWSSSFWSDLLDIEDKHVVLPFVPNRLRIADNDFWGYNELRDEIILKDILKNRVKYFLSRYIR